MTWNYAGVQALRLPVVFLCMFRWRLSELSLTGRRPPSLDGLPEEQGHEGGAVARPDQRAATNLQPRLNPRCFLSACRRSLSVITWFTEILWLVNGTDWSNFTMRSSSHWGGKVYYNQSHHVGWGVGEARAPWWCAFIIDHPEEEVCWLLQRCQHPIYHHP